MSLLWKTKQLKCIALKALAFQCVFTSDYDACEQLTFHKKVFTYFNTVLCVSWLKKQQKYVTSVCFYFNLDY